MSNPDSKIAPANPFAKLLRNVLLGGASTLAVSAFAPSVFAQEASPPAATAPAEEEIVVTGIRGSLQRSLEVKRDAVGVVDAITSEDIGKFPDSNLAQAIQRIPGVSVSRGTTSMGGVPSSTGDATQITVRGFGPSFNQTLYDGRVVNLGVNNNNISGNSRGFDFSAVGSDFVGQVHILKTPDPTLSTGAIGATINILFPKPFDQPGLRLAGSASGSYAPDEGEWTPNGGFLVSDTFNNDTVGVLAAVNYSNRKVRGNHVNNQGWQGTLLNSCQLDGGPTCTFDPDGNFTTPGDSTPTWFTQDYGIYQEHTEDERIDGRVVLQWRPSNNVTLTLNDNYSKDELTQVQYGYSIWFNSGSLREVERNANGTIIDFIQANTPTDFQGQINASVLESNEAGFNARWDVSDNLTIDADIAHSESRLNPDGELGSIDVDIGYGPSTSGGINGTNVGIVAGGGNDLPFVTGFGPGGDASRFTDVTLLGSHVLPMFSQRNVSTVDQIKLEGVWSDDGLTIKFGAQRVEDEKEFRLYSSLANNHWQAYSGYGANSNNFQSGQSPPNNPQGVDLPDEFFHPFSIGDDFIRGWNGNANLVPNLIAFDPYEVLAYLEGLGNPQSTFIPGANFGCYTAGDPALGLSSCNPLFAGKYLLAEEIGPHQDIKEDTTAFFLSVANETMLADMPLALQAGVRVEHTELASSGLAVLPTQLVQQAGDQTAFNVIFGPQTVVTEENEYTYVLPNLDLNLSLTDDLKLRFDASRTLTRPPLNFISPALTMPNIQRVNALVARGGNPGLLPFLSDNIDIGLEWYYAPNSYLAGNVFVKEVTNFIVAGTTTQTINDVIDPTTGQPAQFAVTTNLNGPSAEVKGLELSLQHVFGETGFGVQANATFVDTDKEFDPSDTSTSGFAVTGLANSANLVAFYENYGFEARVAVNWRDEYLDHFGQQQNNSRFGTEPTFVNAGTYVDVSASYAVTDNLSVYFEGLNLTEETFSTHGRHAEQVLDVIDTGARYTVGARMRY